MPAGDTMDSEYSVHTVNRFGFDDDIIEDPLELIRQAQERPKKDKVKAKKDAKKEAKKEDKPKVDEAPENKSQGEGEWVQ